MIVNDMERTQADVDEGLVEKAYFEIRSDDVFPCALTLFLRCIHAISDADVNEFPILH